jgi:ketosteroid isomerase-like protein
MKSKDNKEVVRKFFDAVAEGDTTLMASMLTQDATWWVAPSTIFSGVLTKARWLEIIPMLFANADGKFEIKLGDWTAEEDRVSVTAKGHLKLKDGRVYASDYHFLIWVRDGKIARGKEYMDSAHVNDIFGAPDKVESILK